MRIDIRREPPVEEEIDQWWHGHRVICEYCLSAVVLEKGDDQLRRDGQFFPMVKYAYMGESSPITWTCPVCERLNDHHHIEWGLIGIVLVGVIVILVIVAFA